jgi:beta-mannosidase
MGTLFWQLDDVWPVCSWASIEYSGKWKPLHYAAKRFFAPLLLTAFEREGTVDVWLTNDLPREARGTATISVVDFAGKALRSEKLRFTAKAGSAQRIATRTVTGLGAARDECFLLLGLEHGGATVQNELFLTEYKRCALPRANVQAKVAARAAAARSGAAHGQFAVTLSTDQPAFFVCVDAEGVPGEFDDNCFTLLAGAPRTLSFTPRASTTEVALRKALTVRHLRNTYR